MCRVAVHDERSGRACFAERAFLRTIGGGCSLPIGICSGWQPADGTVLRLSAVILSMDGARKVQAHVEGAAETDAAAEALGVQLCQQLLTPEGQALLAELRAHKVSKEDGDD